MLDILGQAVQIRLNSSFLKCGKKKITFKNRQNNNNNALERESWEGRRPQPSPALGGMGTTPYGAAQQAGQTMCWTRGHPVGSDSNRTRGRGAGHLEATLNGLG